MDSINRVTNETNINISFNAYGSRDIKIETPIGFLNHLLELMAFHACFDLHIKASGDTYVDDHHLVEDIAICLGQLFAKSIKYNQSERYGSSLLPMDETLVMCATDLSNRIGFNYDVSFTKEMLNDLSCEMIEEFLKSFCYNAKINLHLKLISGKNNHHIAEAIFKALGRSIKQSLEVSKIINSTKGCL